ncbi:cupredoxin domain-containing protein [Bdellovibrio sp. SKB1291214]|uniref:cupredoxin domain-containing protein n=1 Tax=Bdellovibrio sp. SKB1291214 TaxID=1732569 RepID=UPI0020CB9B85|nr:cupredoxin domain-containing protein [Bdellovibrio sp. SKB1291214]UYL09014.1 cupredoxin domain-containing protein [Bdellovibrio sp. SKB1291214]
MSFVNSKTVKICTSLVTALFITSVANAWEVDFSRRQVDFNKVTNEDRLPASIKEDQSVSILSNVFDSVEPTQDIVIMNTEKGFVPETVRLKKGNNYRIHVVNVNGKEKNVSFVLDAFSEHHNTVFGEEKTFKVMPKTDGIFSYQCPETAVQGKFIIYSDANSAPGGRKPASN